jgi:predicted aspartyl protease
VSYAYESKGKYPHAPYIQVLLSNPIDETQRITCKALLDTGADCTHVPIRFLRSIRVNATGRAKPFLGFGGEKESTPYVISVRLDSKSFETEVWSWDEDFVLLGRDLLNEYCVEFDGPNLVFMFNY